MTTTVNGHRPDLTEGDPDVRMRVRTPQTPSEAPNRAAERQNAAYTGVPHTRVIPENGSRHKRTLAAASLHVTDAVAAAGRTKTLVEPPLTISAAWAQILPAKGEVDGRAQWLLAVAAGLFRACVIGCVYGLAHAVGTRLRAGVGLCLFLACVAAAALAGTL